MTWGTASTLVTEATAIEHIAAAYTTSGDVVVFYTLTGTTTLKSIRRTGGVWAGSGTAWSRGGSAASLTGIAVAYDGADFALLIAGTEVTTTNPRVWAIRMGDTFLPAGAWSSLNNAVAEADALSTVSFAAPSIALVSLNCQGTYAQLETGDVAVSRAFTSHPQPSGSVGSVWREGAPHEAQGDHGLAIATDTAGGQVIASRPGGVWLAPIGTATSYTDQLVSCSYTIGLESARCSVELDDVAGTLLADGALFAGAELAISGGYVSNGASAEFGVTEAFTIDRVLTRVAGGRRTVTVEASSAWEHLARWRAPQAWQVAAGVKTRSQVFQRIAARAGCAWALGTDPDAPSSDWSAYSPAFSVAIAETGAAVLKRLLAVVPDFIRANGVVAEVVSTTTSDTVAKAYAWPEYSALARVADAGDVANWLRVQGPDRYADAMDFDGIYAHGAEFRQLRNLDADTDAKANAWSANALRRVVVEKPAAQLTAPFHPGLQLLDRVTVDSDVDGHIVELGMRYKRSPAGAQYETIATIGGL